MEQTNKGKAYRQKRTAKIVRTKNELSKKKVRN